MYSNCYGAEGVAKLVKMMKDEIIADAGNLGIADIHEITPAVVSLFGALVFSSPLSIQRHKVKGLVHLLTW
jgi:hypothetical protein